MKRVMTSALVLSLLAGGAAFAQERPGMQNRGGPRQDRPQQAQPQQRPDGGGRQFQQRQERGDAQRGQGAGDRGNRGDRGGRGDWGQRPQAQQQPQAQSQPQQIGPSRGDRNDDRPAADGRRDNDRWNNDRRDDDRWSNDRRDNDRADRDRGGRDRWDNDRNRPGFDGRPGAGRPPQVQPGRPGAPVFRDRDRGRQQYDQRRWGPTFRAPQRFRVPAWRPPVGYYAYSWRFGDYLPRGWFGTTYYLDWFRYGLPMPPIGCEWVRSGDDAVLVDTFTGRVLSVAYDIFW